MPYDHLDIQNVQGGLYSVNDKTGDIPEKHFKNLAELVEFEFIQITNDDQYGRIFWRIFRWRSSRRPR